MPLQDILLHAVLVWSQLWQSENRIYTFACEMNIWGGSGILHIHNYYSTQFWLRRITPLSVYFWTLSILSDPTDKDTLNHLERKPDSRWIYRERRLTCIVQSMTVTLSHRSKLVSNASLHLQCLITTLCHLCVLVACLHPAIWEEWRSYWECLESAKMTAAVSHTLLRTPAWFLHQHIFTSAGGLL